MTWTDPLTPLYLDRASLPERVPADRQELLSALISGPRFDPMFRGEVISLPPEHSTYYWKCLVQDCERPNGMKDSKDLCYEHNREWVQFRRAGGDRAMFLTTAAPKLAARWTDAALCRICPDRPAQRSGLHPGCWTPDTLGS
ncbi:hypothetical protein AB0H34_18375 [Saccharopolyspora shandongensis]|uniref:hypothetical protein n=1 Tax=Saccharopolyspora shandongensis TaxID=418495 RepID=UPI0033DE5DCF